MSTVTVVGNGVGGFACARRLAELGCEVAMIGPGLPYDRPPLSKRALESGNPPMLATHAQLVELGIEHVDATVEAVDLEARTLELRACTGATTRRVFGPLVWATGLAPAFPPVPGLDRAHCNATADGMRALAASLAGDARRVVVIGAGLIGTETAATLARRHSVTLLDMAERPLARFDGTVSAVAELALRDSGVRFLGGCEIDAVEPGIVRSRTHGVLEAEVIVAATGVRSTVPAALGRGPALDTDETLAVIGRDRVWACGDVARFPHPRFGPLTIPHWDHARASGRHAAEAVLDSREPYRRDPYWFSDIGRTRVQQIGLPDPVVEWFDRDGIRVGHDELGRPACVLLIDSPHRLHEARALVAA